LPAYSKAAAVNAMTGIVLVSGVARAKRFEPAHAGKMDVHQDGVRSVHAGDLYPRLGR
jgi:hypothetical protein